MKPILAALALVMPSCMASKDANGWRLAFDLENAAKAMRVIYYAK